MFRSALVASTFALLVSGVLAQSSRGRGIRANDRLREICAAVYSDNEEDDKEEVVVHRIKDGQVSAIRQLFLSLSPDDNKDINQEPETRRFRPVRFRGHRFRTHPKQRHHGGYGHHVDTDIALNFGNGGLDYGGQDNAPQSRILDAGKNAWSDLSKAERSVIADQMLKKNEEERGEEEPIINKVEQQEDKLLVQPEESKILIQPNQQSKSPEIIEERPELGPIVGPPASPSITGSTSATTEPISPDSKRSSIKNGKPAVSERRRKGSRRPRRRHRASVKGKSLSSSRLETTTSDSPIIDAAKPEEPIGTDGSGPREGSSGVGNEKTLVALESGGIDTPIAQRIGRDLLEESRIRNDQHRIRGRSKVGGELILTPVKEEDRNLILDNEQRNMDERQSASNLNVNKNINRNVNQNSMYNRGSAGGIKTLEDHAMGSKNFRRSAIGPSLNENADYNANVNTNVNTLDIGQGGVRRPYRRFLNAHQDVNANSNVNHNHAARPLLGRILSRRSRIDRGSTYSLV